MCVCVCAAVPASAMGFLCIRIRIRHCLLAACASVHAMLQINLTKLTGVRFLRVYTLFCSICLFCYSLAKEMFCYFPLLHCASFCYAQKLCPSAIQNTHRQTTQSMAHICICVAVYGVRRSSVWVHQFVMRLNGTPSHIYWRNKTR